MTFDLENAWDALDEAISPSGQKKVASELNGALAEIERLRAENAGLSKAVIDIQEGRDLAQAEFRTYHKAWEEQQAELARVNHLRETEIDRAGAAERMYLEGARLKAARIKELEASWEELCDRIQEKEARIQELEDALVEKQTQLMPTAPSCYAEARRRAAINQLQAEGKIGPDASKPRSWQITDARKAALRHLVAICPYENCSATGIIKAMLEGAGQ